MKLFTLFVLAVSLVLVGCEKKPDDAMSIFKEVAKRYPKHAYGHLAQARLKSAAGDFAGAAEEVKQAQAVAISEAQRTALKPFLDRLEAKQDINK